VESLFATVFPSDCRLCAAPLVNISRLPVCEECLAAMRPIGIVTCAICGERLLSPYIVSSEARCEMCRRAEPPFARAAAYGSYERGLRELLHLLKYEGVLPAADVLGRMLGQAITGLEAAFGDAPILVVPVPLHRSKLRQRGFNQAELIAQAALKARARDGSMILNARVLERRRPTQSQTGLTRHQRRENVRGAFAVAKPDEVSGREILVVDDVYTTGTTLSECARILRRAGASKVWVATVARTLKADAQQMEPRLEVETVVAARA
jgi:ComF family protein